MAREKITVYVFKYGVGGHYWAAIFDFKVKMVSEHGKNLSIRSVMSNLAGKYALFAFVGSLFQEISSFLVFNMALAAILDLKVKIVPKHKGYYSIRFVVPTLVGNDTLNAFWPILFKRYYAF